MIVRTSLAAAGATLAVATFLCSPVPAQAATPHPSAPRTPRARTTPASPEEVRQATKLAPLRSLASAVIAAGESEFRGVYGGTRLQPGTGRLEVFLTDTAQATRLLASARHIDAQAATNLAVIKRAKYSEQQLLHRSNLIMAQARGHKLPFTVYSTVIAPDGSGLTVQVADPQQVRHAIAAGPGAGAPKGFDQAVTVEQGQPVRALDGGREDFPELIGAGLQILPPDGTCTSGLPFYDQVTKASYVISAFHCFELLDPVNTPSHLDVGKTTGISKPTDSAMIELPKPLTSAVDYEFGVPDEDQGGIYGMTITAVGDVAANDVICHDGFASFSFGKGAPCGWKLVGKTQYNLTAHGITYTVTGMQTKPGTSSAVAYPGDSGAAVFVRNGSYTVKGLGMVSAGAGCNPACTTLNFTTVRDIAAQFNRSPLISTFPLSR